MNTAAIGELKKEMDTLNDEIAAFRKKSRTGKAPSDMKAWIAEEKRLLKKKQEIDDKMCEYYQNHD